MELNALMSTLLGSDSIAGLSKRADVSEEDVKKVLASAMPQLLAGAQGQAQDEETAEGFAQALKDHAADDTSDVRGFLDKVDDLDGGKILAHLLGLNQGTITESAAASSGLKPAQVLKILSVAAPLLMSLLGKQAGKEDQSVGVGTLMSALLGKNDTASLVQTLLFGKKKKKGLLSLLFGR